MNRFDAAVLRLIDLISPLAPPPRNAGGLGAEAFGCNWPGGANVDGGPLLEHRVAGVPEIIGYRGEWYARIRPKLRVRVANRLVSWLNRRDDMLQFDEPERLR